MDNFKDYFFIVGMRCIWRLTPTHFVKDGFYQWNLNVFPGLFSLVMKVYWGLWKNTQSTITRNGTIKAKIIAFCFHLKITILGIDTVRLNVGVGLEVCW